MAYIQHQQAQAASGGGQQAEVMSDTYEVQMGGHGEQKPHLVTIPIDSGRTDSTNSIGQNNHQQQQQPQRTPGQRNHAEVVRSDGDNHQSSSTSSTEERQENNDGSIEGQEGLDAASVIKTPNSYKYPLLKRYYEFGPWIGRNRKAICLGCRLQTSSSQPDRLLKHLNRCSALSETDKVAVTELMNERTANKRKRPTVKLKRPENDDDSYFGDDEPNASLADDLTLSSINTTQNSISILPHTLKKPKPTDRKSQIDEALTRFIVTCRIPLKAIHSKEFIELIRCLDPTYRVPPIETITNVLIPGMLNII